MDLAQLNRILTEYPEGTSIKKPCSSYYRAFFMVTNIVL